MNTFFRENGVLVCELEEFQKRAMKELDWSYQTWQRRLSGAVELSKAERIALAGILNEMRNGAKVVYNIPEEKE